MKFDYDEDEQNSLKAAFDYNSVLILTRSSLEICIEKIIMES